MPSTTCDRRSPPVLAAAAASLDAWSTTWTLPAIERIDAVISSIVAAVSPTWESRVSELRATSWIEEPISSIELDVSSTLVASAWVERLTLSSARRHLDHRRRGLFRRPRLGVGPVGDLLRRGRQLLGRGGDLLGRLLDLGEDAAQVGGHLLERLPQEVGPRARRHRGPQVAAGDPVGHCGHLAEVGDHPLLGTREVADLVGRAGPDLRGEIPLGQPLRDRDRLRQRPGQRADHQIGEHRQREDAQHGHHRHRHHRGALVGARGGEGDLHLSLVVLCQVVEPVAHLFVLRGHRLQGGDHAFAGGPPDHALRGLPRQGVVLPKALAEGARRAGFHRAVLGGLLQGGQELVAQAVGDGQRARVRRGDGVLQAALERGQGLLQGVARFIGREVPLLNRVEQPGIAHPHHLEGGQDGEEADRREHRQPGHLVGEAQAARPGHPSRPATARRAGIDHGFTSTVLASGPSAVPTGT